MSCCTCYASLTKPYCLLFLLSLLSSFRSAFWSIMTSIRTKMATKSTNRSRACLMWSVSACSAFSTMTCSIGEPRWEICPTVHDIICQTTCSTTVGLADKLLALLLHTQKLMWDICNFTHCDAPDAMHILRVWPKITNEQDLPECQTGHIQWTSKGQHIALLERQMPCHLESTTPGA